MDLWLTRKRGKHLIGVERVPLEGFEDLFEADLARQGAELRLYVGNGGQEVALKGLMLPSLSQLERTGRTAAIKDRVRSRLTALDTRLREAARLDPGETASVLGSVAVLDALLRAKRPYTAVIVA